MNASLHIAFYGWQSNEGYNKSYGADITSDEIWEKANLAKSPSNDCSAIILTIFGKYRNSK